MNMETAYEILRNKNVAVQSIGRWNFKWYVEVANCGRNFDKVKKFKGKTIEEAVNKVLKALDF